MKNYLPIIYNRIDILMLYETSLKVDEIHQYFVGKYISFNKLILGILCSTSYAHTQVYNHSLDLQHNFGTNEQVLFTTNLF